MDQAARCGLLQTEQESVCNFLLFGTNYYGLSSKGLGSYRLNWQGISATKVLQAILIFASHCTSSKSLVI